MQSFRFQDASRCIPILQMLMQNAKRENCIFVILSLNYQLIHYLYQNHISEKKIFNHGFKGFLCNLFKLEDFYVYWSLHNGNQIISKLAWRNYLYVASRRIWIIHKGICDSFLAILKCWKRDLLWRSKVHQTEPFKLRWCFKDNEII